MDNETLIGIITIVVVAIVVVVMKLKKNSAQSGFLSRKPGNTAQSSGYGNSSAQQGGNAALSGSSAGTQMAGQKSKFCVSCGREIPFDSRFCEFCGNPQK